MYYVFDRGPRPGRWGDTYPFQKGISWIAGARFRQHVQEPIVVTLKPLNPDAEDHGPEIPEYLLGKIPLFRQDLIDALTEVGVDNLDLYDAIIVDPDSGERHTSHKAVNIIGAISAANLGESGATVHAGVPLLDVTMDRIVLDEAKVHGALMFRLAESLGKIMVDEKVRDYLLSGGFQNLMFHNPNRVATL